MYLLDTLIISELRHARAGQTDAGLTRWAAGVPKHNLFISALSLMELEAAVMQAERRDKAAATGLRGWLDHQVMKAFEDRILPVDAAVSRRCAHLAISDTRDALLAATALVHGLTLVTRNPSAFKPGRVKVFNPWGYSSGGYSSGGYKQGHPDAVADGSADEAADWREGTRTGSLWFKNLFVRF